MRIPVTGLGRRLAILEVSARLPRCPMTSVAVSAALVSAACLFR